MEAEKKAAEEEERKKKEKEAKIKEGFSFSDAKAQWEKDKETIAKNQERQAADSAEKPRKSSKPGNKVEKVPHGSDT